MFRLGWYYKKATVAAGVLSFNTRHLHGDLMSLHVKPATSTTTWKLELVGANSLYVWDSKQKGIGETGEANILLWSINSINEVLTVNFTSVSQNEDFEFELRVREYQLR